MNDRHPQATYGQRYTILDDQARTLLCRTCSTRATGVTIPRDEQAAHDQWHADEDARYAALEASILADRKAQAAGHDCADTAQRVGPNWVCPCGTTWEAMGPR